MVTQPLADVSAMKFPSLDLDKIALLLDVDGTLVDLKPSPNEAHVSPELRGSLGAAVAADSAARWHWSAAAR